MNSWLRFASVFLIAALAGCAAIKGDIDESPRVQAVDENVFLLNVNAYDLGSAFKTINDTAQQVCDGRESRLADSRAEPLGDTRSWYVVKTTILCEPATPVVVEPEPESGPELPWDANDAPILQGQKALNALGYSVGTMDGTMSETTTEAVNAYQAAAGLPVSGVFDVVTSGNLGTAPASNEMSVAVIIAVQEALEESGFEVGRIDGIIGKKTINALRDFQTEKNLDASGELDSATARALGLIKGQ
ncbi:MAG: peptidoglycan-binding domain-containing protein [Pseudomonadota bacterium]